MNEYIAKIEKLFGGHAIFEIEALSKEEAKRKAIEKAEMYGKENYKLNTLKIKKVRKFKN